MGKLFMVFMRVNSKFAKEFNFKTSSEDILGAKEEFNTGDERRLLISKMNKYDMEVILKLPGIEEDIEDIGPHINPFVDMIYSRIAQGRNPGELDYIKRGSWYDFKERDMELIYSSLKKRKSNLYVPEELEALFEGLMEDGDQEAEEDEEDISAEPRGHRTGTIEDRKADMGKSLGEIIKELNALVGMESAKLKFREIVKAGKSLRARGKGLGISEPQVSFSLVIAGGAGSGKETLARLFYKAYYHLGIVKNKNFVRIEGQNLTGYRPVEGAVRGMEGGLVYLDGIEALLSGENPKSARNNNMDTVLKEIEKYRDKFTFIVSGEPQYVSRFMEYKRIKNHIKFEVKIDDYSLEELLSYGKALAARSGYRITRKGIKSLREVISSLKESGKLDGMPTVSRLIEDAIIKNCLRIDYKSTSQKDGSSLDSMDFPSILEETASDTINSETTREEIDSLIGMESVKKRIREIADYAAIQRLRQEAGIGVEPLCLHMCFTGNPGTGKTTVARYLGKLLYEMGVLKKDAFVEVSRQDLVGGYIGQSAIKTVDKINQAMGGVLLIDEAYTLFADSERDYGHEVVAELIKKMEDYRDKFVVIMAGYTHEMERFLGMNPGLKDRVQFKIEFPDYSPEELVEIFKKFCSDKDYKIDEMGEAELLKVFTRIYSTRDVNFANARTVRKCFERVKLAQAGRIMRSRNKELEDLRGILKEDIVKLYEDEDIRRMARREVRERRSIGFIG